ncbi:MAG TPA: hypothetical protein PKC43_12115 [Phycisphaerales bacterium]|nr:hypothetical protein [Phycisphaerales bacterium]HMP38177.1 hypothetical protein [Phycisphaerales bacterium]
MRNAHERLIEPLGAVAEECAVGRGPHESPEAAALFGRLVSDRNRAVASMASLERSLLLQFGEDLSLDEASRSRIEHRRLVQRRDDMLMLACDLLPARISLEPIVERAVGSTLGQERPECLVWALERYADEIDGLHAQRVRMKLRDLADDAAEFTAVSGGGPSIIESRRRRNAPRVRIERLLVEANRDWAQRIAECLGAERGRSFTDEFLAASYPPVHPNPFSLRSLIDELRRDGDPVSRAGAITALEDLDARMDEDSRRMERLCVEAWKDWALTHAGRSLHQREPDLKTALEPLDRRRRDAAIEAIELLKSEGLVTAPPSLDRLVDAVAAPWHSSAGTAGVPPRVEPKNP